MTKQGCIALADFIRAQVSPNREENYCAPFTQDQILLLADFCESQNPLFKRGRWLDYVSGKRGSNGGSK